MACGKELLNFTGTSLSLINLHMLNGNVLYANVFTYLYHGTLDHAGRWLGQHGLVDGLNCGLRHVGCHDLL